MVEAMGRACIGLTLGIMSVVYTYLSAPAKERCEWKRQWNHLFESGTRRRCNLNHVGGPSAKSTTVLSTLILTDGLNVAEIPGTAPRARSTSVNRSTHLSSFHTK